LRWPIGPKPVVLTFIGHYLPSDKASGILRANVNTVDHLHDEFEFKIVTRDRDLGDKKAFDGIKLNQWQQVGNASVCYLPPCSRSPGDIYHLIKDTPHDVLYLNSFFDPFTVYALLNRKGHRKTFKPVVVAPWGDFGWASLKQKYYKKFFFIHAAKLMGLYHDVTWRASSEFEKADIMKVMNVRPEEVHITLDLPVKENGNNSCGPGFVPFVHREGLRIVFLSRIAPEKNLDYALKVLNKVRSRVVFDIYGPAENQAYWNGCQGLISKLPSHVKVNYRGSVKPDQVPSVLSKYDLFFLPTGGEAYGHVIAECLISGTPVLISTQTPWRDLEAAGLGWDVNLDQMDSFIAVIEKLALWGPEQHREKRVVVKAGIRERLSDPTVLDTNRKLFNERLRR
jgi:glycosyltransferase involved in cell wall biosynthesis